MSLLPPAAQRPAEVAGCGNSPQAPDATPLADPLAERLASEMTAAWQRGERRPAEEFLARYPDLTAHPEAAVRLVYEELCLRQEAGEKLSAAKVLRRFPQWQTELEVFFACYDFLEPALTGSDLAAVGDRLGDFQLLAELARGAHGWVFLASQPALADRPLVLKVTPQDGAEPLALARLLHTHIVPLYFVQDFPARRLQALAMPYLGGTTLARLLQALAAVPAERRRGRDLLAALDAVEAAAPVKLPARGPARHFLGTASYPEAIAWIGACLADALQYAHERGLVHLDVKPSNVLLAADGQPLLLDFHLAREPVPPDAPGPTGLGGTPGYMSPEQQTALQALAMNRPPPVAVDGHSDLYSLGVLLYEALSGVRPPLGEGPLPRLDGLNRCVSRGLADIVHKCLASDPAGRYADAASLGADLRRHLANQPLRGVVNRSLRERWRKWRRRRPHVLALTGMLLAALVVISVATLAAGSRLRASNRRRLLETTQAAQAALVDGQQQRRKHQYAEATRTLARGLALAEGLADRPDLAEALAGQLRLAHRAAAAETLHDLVERLRFLYGLEAISGPRLREWDERAGAAWHDRERFLSPPGLEAEAEVERRTRTDLLDLAVLWVDLHIRAAAPDGAAAARREALRVLAEAEVLLGPSPVLYRQRQACAEALGQTELARAAARDAAALPPRSAWEHYALGRFLLESGQLESAAAEFGRAVDLRPNDLWANFCQGVCAHRLHRYEAARTAFQVCVALAPRCAACYYNRAVALTALGETEPARSDYGRALDLEPGLAAAALNRAILSYQTKRYAEALADLERALTSGADPAPVYQNLVLIQRAQGTRQAGLSQPPPGDPGYQEARELLDQLRGHH